MVLGRINRTALGTKLLLTATYISHSIYRKSSEEGLITKEHLVMHM